jgi:hypothetical protein
VTGSAELAALRSDVAKNVEVVNQEVNLRVSGSRV